MADERGRDSRHPRVGSVGVCLVVLAGCLSPLLARNATGQVSGRVHLLKDIESTVTLSSDPTNLVTVGTRLFFVAKPGGTVNDSYALYVSDGTAAGTKALCSFDYYVGRGPVVVGSEVAFVAWTDYVGWQLWGSDGTSAGTSPLAVLLPASFEDGQVAALRSSGARAFALVSDAAGHTTLWSWSGSLSQPELVARYVEFNSSLVVPAAGLLFFSVERPGAAAELWRSDGTAGGTFMVGTLGPAGASVGWSGAAVGSLLLFSVLSPASEWELWRTDGTVVGTSRVIAPTGAWRVNLVGATTSRAFMVIESMLSQELWASDGTSAGTVRVLPNANLAASYAAVGERMYFGAPNGDTSSTIWTSDGSAAGTHAVASLADVDLIDNLTAVGSSLAFVAVTGDRANQLGVSDGTPAGTKVIDLDPGSPVSPDPRDFAALEGRLYFSALHPIYGRELWGADLSGSNPAVAVDINRATESSNPRLARAAGPWVVFEGGNVQVGRALWRTDGTETGTTLLADLGPLLEPHTGALFQDLVTVGTHVYAWFIDDGTAPSGLWMIDADSGATTKLATTLCPADFATVWSGFNLGGNAYVLASACDESFGLYRIDHDTGQVTLVRGLPFLGSSNPQFIGSPDGARVYFWFFTNDAIHGTYQELWITDGTTEGTQWIADPPYVDTGFLGSTLLFACRPPGAALPELCRTDGTTGGTYQIGAGPIPTNPGLFVSNGRIALFVGADPEHGVEPWITDGTSGGTHILRDIWPGPGPGILMFLDPALDFRRWATFGNGFLFSAQDPVNGEQVWFTDGTEAGTRLFQPLFGPPTQRRLMDGVTFDGLTYLSLLDPTLPYPSPYLVGTDGTTAGTSLAFQGNLPLPVVDQFGFKELNGRLYFDAYTPQYGFEPWTVDPSPRRAVRRHLQVAK